MRLLRYVGGAILGLVLIVAASGYFALRASLPRIDGEIASLPIGATATIERDATGVPAITGSTRRDLAFATGYAHAQDRFFQMDLMRRAASGELAELLGSAVVDTDKRLRIHGFRKVAQQVLARAPQSDRVILSAYTAGVNAALAHSGARPWEYLVLRAQPRAWLDEDSILTAFSMYLSLNDASGEEELARAQLREALPPELFAFLHPIGTEWDAPIVGGPWRAPPIPGPEVADIHRAAPRAVSLSAAPSMLLPEESPFVGSNSWAVAGTHTQDGAALLANDMHLGLRLPHIWYHARLKVAGGTEQARDLVGVTLPGLPLIVVGSNGHVAWGYTNSYGDWTDLVVVEPDPAHPQQYLVGDTSEPFDVHRETIQVRGAEPASLEVKATRWGPIVNRDAAGHELALEWTAHHPQATNLRMLDFESATTLEEILHAANTAGVPVQNFVAVDAHGRIGWSVMGQVPIRTNYDSTVPTSWRAAGTGWTGWRQPEEYPRVIDPAAGRLWTANTRTIDAQTWLAFLGEGDYDLGARAAQIRDDLFALQNASAADLVKVQLDDRALFLSRWRDLLLDLLKGDAAAGHELRKEARQLVEHWSTRAAADDVGYRIVRAFRLEVRKDVFDSLTAAARMKYPQTRFVPSGQFEGPLWQLVTQQPVHLLDPRYGSWNEALLASFDEAMDTLVKECGELSRCTWGRQNTLQMRHPLSAALPFAAKWLDMPAEQISGDASMPRVAGPAFGASERLVVSPGKESQGLFQMPGGPVDHPLSPFYAAGHEAWVRGESRPLLPGTAQHTLRLTPQR
ncbi:MAG TPA: penicillin acylase family protein [Steroidobacteraceae bacterium]